MPTTLYADDSTSLRFDGVTSVRVAMASSVTRHPTERGAVISDHVQREPTIVSIVGVLTETPTAAQAAAPGAMSGLSGPDRVQAGMAWFSAHQGQRLTLVSDKMDDLDDLVIVRLPDEVTVMRHRIVTLELQQIVVATATLVDIPPELPPAATSHAVASAADLGEQGATSGDADPAQQARDISAASSLLSYFGGN